MIICNASVDWCTREEFSDQPIDANSANQLAHSVKGWSPCSCMRKPNPVGFDGVMLSGPKTLFVMGHNKRKWHKRSKMSFCKADKRSDVFVFCSWMQTNLKIDERRQRGFWDKTVLTIALWSLWASALFLPNADTLQSSRRALFKSFITLYQGDNKCLYCSLMLKLASIRLLK